MDKILFRKFLLHHASAIKRGIDFELTFDQWLKIWTDSGHIKERGVRYGGYVMGRNNDEGPYAIGNVYITTISGNVKDGYRFRKEKNEIKRKNKQIELLIKAKKGLSDRESIRKARIDRKEYYSDRMREKFNYTKGVKSIFNYCKHSRQPIKKWY